VAPKAQGSQPAPSYTAGKQLQTSPLMKARISAGSDEPVDEDDPVEAKASHEDHFGSRFAIRSGNPVRLWWDTVMICLLLYTATWFLFELCFLHFHVLLPIETHEFLNVPELLWVIWSYVYDGFFWLDVLANFFLTFNDEGHEIDSLKVISLNYLQGYFMLDVMACLPEWATIQVLKAFHWEGSQDASGNLAKSAKLARLNRIPHLLRLLRTRHLFKASRFKETKVWNMMQGLRGVRVVNFFCMLFFSVHLLACGWYLVAALQEDVNETWLARPHSVLHHGKTLLELDDPWTQWATSMYFVLTVFTTVGFGDISAFTVVEICSVAVIFMLGAVVHSILVGEVINTVTTVEAQDKFVAQQSELIQHFSIHTELGPNIVQCLMDWAAIAAKNWMSHQYDTDGMKKLISGRYMHRSLLGQLPSKMFGGDLLRNQFTRCLTLFDDAGFLPPRLPLFMALAMYRASFDDGEAMFLNKDHANNVFLITSGTFAYIGQPRKEGGRDAPPRIFSLQDTKEPQLYPYMLFGKNSYIGEYEALLNEPRTASCRCEKSGTALVVGRHDMRGIIEEFPEFGPIWFSEAQRRERHRKRCLRRLRHRYRLHDFAAIQIQTSLRAWREHGYKKPAKGGLNQAMQQAQKITLMTQESPPEASAQPSPRIGGEAQGLGELQGSKTPSRGDQGRHEADDDVERLDYIVEEMRRMQETFNFLVTSVDRAQVKIDSLPSAQASGVAVV